MLATCPRCRAPFRVPEVGERWVFANRPEDVGLVIEMATPSRPGGIDIVIASSPIRSRSTLSFDWESLHKCCELVPWFADAKGVPR